MNGYYDQIIKKLREAGYEYLRPAKGSHEVWTNGLRNQAVPRTKSRDTANEIMKQCGIKHKF